MDSGYFCSPTAVPGRKVAKAGAFRRFHLLLSRVCTRNAGGAPRHKACRLCGFARKGRSTGLPAAGRYGAPGAGFHCTALFPIQKIARGVCLRANVFYAALSFLMFPLSASEADTLSEKSREIHQIAARAIIV